MLVPMAQLELIGHRDRLTEHLAVLQRLRAVEVATTDDPPPPPATAAATSGDAARASADEAELNALLGRFDALLDATPHGDAPGDGAGGGAGGAGGDGAGDAVRHTTVGAVPVAAEWTVEGARALVDVAERAQEELADRVESVSAEREVLPRTHRSLAALVALVPELSDLTDADLRELDVATIVVVLDDPAGTVQEQIAADLSERFGDRHLFVSAPVEGAVGSLLVLPVGEVAAAEQVLGRDQVAAVELPGRYAGLSLRSTVTRMRARLDVLPAVLVDAEGQLAAARRSRRADLLGARGDLAVALERCTAARRAEIGSRTYVLRLWTPRHRIAAVTAALAAADPATAVTEVPTRRWLGSAPMLLRNARAARPFERLVGFLAWPQPGSLDPTGLMAVVLPAMFGVMVGDIGYGVLLAGAGWWVRRRFGRRSTLGEDAGRVLLVGGLWATVFGALYGELFGNLGSSLGMPALWFYRGGPDALTPLLLFVLGIGAAHIVLGLLLGIWLAVRQRDLPHALERGGNLLVLVGLFALAGVVTSLLPGGALPPAVAAVVIGLVASSVPHGALGLLLGPLEALARLGNVLSYLRLAAVGLASVYLAVVANELGREAPLLLGIVIAVFFHALNLALAVFSPMIQALRLHYVEFFGTFFAGGGRPFTPLGAAGPARPPAPQGVPAPPAAAPSASPREPVAVG